MNIHIFQRQSTDDHKVYYTLEWGRDAGTNINLTLAFLAYNIAAWVLLPI